MSTNSALFARREAAVVRGIGHSTPISAARALNSEVWDVEGRRLCRFCRRHCQCSTLDTAIRM